MPISRPATWLVCYDIADQRRLQRVHKKIMRHGVPLQYSVFVMEATKPGIKNVLDQIVNHHIDIRHDDLRAYPLMESSPAFIFGKKQLPSGVVLPGRSAPGFGLFAENSREVWK